VSNFLQICSVVIELWHEDTRLDRQTERKTDTAC